MLDDVYNLMDEVIAEWVHEEYPCLFHYFRKGVLTFSWVDKDKMCHRKMVDGGEEADLEEIDKLLRKRGFTRYENGI